MKSMTGFGRGEYSDTQYEFIVEIKTINHRYKDFSIRMSRKLSSVEDKIRKKVNTYVARGRIEIYVHFESLNQKKRDVKVDLGLANGYYNALNQIKQAIPQIDQDINLSLIAGFPEVIQVEENEYNIDELWDILSNALNNALVQLNSTRIEEGNHLKSDLLYRCNEIETKVKNIETLAPEVEIEYKKRLRDKILEYANSLEIDDTRLMTEVALFADKTSITEEITRLYSHIQQFKNTLNEESVGRKLDFVVQEMNREINTIGSKGNHYSISSEVVAIKSELEKIREQVQNIE